MKNILSIALLVAAGSLSPATAAHAQKLSLEAKVPFAFTSGETTLPAGIYQIKTVDQSPMITLANQQGRRFMVLARHEPDSHVVGNKLVFHRYGYQYFLSAIHSNTREAPNVALPLTQAEKRAKRQTLEAGLKIEEPVLVAMN